MAYIMTLIYNTTAVLLRFNITTFCFVFKIVVYILSQRFATLRAVILSIFVMIYSVTGCHLLELMMVSVKKFASILDYHCKSALVALGKFTLSPQSILFVMGEILLKR